MSSGNLGREWKCRSGLSEGNSSSAGEESVPQSRGDHVLSNQSSLREDIPRGVRTRDITHWGSVSDGVGSGHELQIVRINEECIELDEVALKRILLDDRVKDKPVAVVSVAGAFRTGKSFLLGFFLRYLHNLGRSVWLGDPDAPLRGFQWRDGCDRHTTGILVWNEVFVYRSMESVRVVLLQVKTSKGQEIAVLLMDTQGCTTIIPRSRNRQPSSL
ncbi:hypothetical protein HPB49_020435 [Dermacentor silvarum]|uniref:Uncharacterized protein n=1 Tax=Dermacentor silvarum TaxID=543639 RepID=A0ACB8C5J8_DERSI|nr:hypothetical protein HPB49_020435 [Dermacentor silvarum]